jgi:hypothetical protein
MMNPRVWRPIASKLTTRTSLFPRIVRCYATELPAYELIKVSAPKPGVGLSTNEPIQYVSQILGLIQSFQLR